LCAIGAAPDVLVWRMIRAKPFSELRVPKSLPQATEESGIGAFRTTKNAGVVSTRPDSNLTDLT